MKESAGSEAREGRSAAVHAGGFSIVELLVVVSLGAILVATVLPAPNTAQDTLKAAVCLGNMHQWGLAISLYNDDQRDYYPYDGEPITIPSTPAGHPACASCRRRCAGAGMEHR